MTCTGFGDPDWHDTDEASRELYAAHRHGDRIVGWAMAVRTSEGELLHLGKIAGVDGLRRVVVTDEEDLGSALARDSVDVGSGDVPS